MSHRLDGEIALDLDGLSYRAPNGAVLLDAVTLHLLPGEILAVVGLNGAGKSTLIRSHRLADRARPVWNHLQTNDSHDFHSSQAQPEPPLRHRRRAQRHGEQSG